MLKRFLIPIFALTVTAIGCAGSSSDVTGGAGKLGAADGGADADNVPLGDGGVPECNVATFCPIYLAYCGTTTPGYTTVAECMTTYAAIGAANPYKQQCESYHLCIAIFDTGADRTLHCSHAVGADNQCGF